MGLPKNPWMHSDSIDSTQVQITDWADSPVRHKLKLQNTDQSPLRQLSIMTHRKKYTPGTYACLLSDKHKFTTKEIHLSHVLLVNAHKIHTHATRR